MNEDVFYTDAIEVLARSFAESAPGAFEGCWVLFTPKLRNRWRDRALCAELAYLQAVGQR